MTHTTPYTKETGNDCQRPVASIEFGTVIDHIAAGKALLLLRLLGLKAYEQQITIGLNLPSTRFGVKDIIKVDGWVLTPFEASRIAVFSPFTTVNTIRNFKVFDKFPVKLPEYIEGVIVCPNKSCITNHEAAPRLFYISEVRKEILFSCKYCEKAFRQTEITQYGV